MEDEDAAWMEVVKLNANDFWRGYFYFNDMEPPEDAVGLECNTREHAGLSLGIKQWWRSLRLHLLRTRCQWCCS